MEKIDSQALGLKINFAINLYDLEKYNEAKLQFDYMLENYEFDFPEFFVAYANCLLKLEEKAKAKSFFKKALEEKNSLDDAKIGLAKCFVLDEDYNSAEKLYGEILENCSSLLIASNLAYVYEKQKRFDEAENLYLTILNIDSSLYDVWNNLASFYKEHRKNKENAILAHKECLNLNNEYNYIKNYAITLQHFNELTEALQIVLDLEKENKNDADLYNLLGVIYQKLFSKNKSFESFEKALEIDSKNYEIMFNYALCLFIFGEYKKGFKYYKNRYLSPTFTDKEKIFENKAKYDGSVVKDKIILVYAEQGFGDSIQFVRFLKILKEKSQAKIVLQCQKSLVRLFKNYEFIDDVIAFDKKVEFDYFMALMDIPAIFDLDYKYIENSFVKLKISNKDLIQSKKLKVGLVWRGNPNQACDFYRSTKLQTYKELFDLENIEFYSLQIDEESKNELKEFPFVNDLSSEIKDFDDTAKLIENLDLVISTDTSVAHLSATLDKKTYLMLMYNGEWRWGIGDKKTIWYPSVKVFKQEKSEDWGSVVNKIKLQVTEDLKS